MSEIENVAGDLCGVTDHRRLPGIMPSRRRGIEALPPERHRRLLFEGLIRHVGRVHEEVRIGLEVVEGFSDEFEMGLRDRYPVCSVPVRIEGRIPASGHPETVLRPIPGCREHDLFVIATEHNQPTLELQADKSIDDTLGVWTVIDEIAEDNDRVMGSRLDGIEESAQGDGTSVDVSDGDGTFAMGWRSVGHAACGFSSMIVPRGR